MLKLEIVLMPDPSDQDNKSARPALLYGPPQFNKGELWQLAIPMTKKFTGHKSCAFLSGTSPAFKSTGLTVSCHINIGSAFRYRVFCETAELCKRTGHFLNLAKDAELQVQFGAASKEAAHALSDFQKIPVAF